MRKFISLVVVAVLTVVLSGCDQKKEFDNDVSNLKGAQKVVSEYRGPVVHRSIFATKVSGKSVKISEGIYVFTIGIESQSKPIQLVGLTCFAEQQLSVVAHTIMDNAGNPIRKVSTLSIMKYRKGINDIHEVDEKGKPVFSTAEGDDDFVKGIKELSKLDPDTPVAFTIENYNPQTDLWETVGWSPLMYAGALAKAAERMPWHYCEGIPIPIEEDEAVSGYTNQELVDTGKQIVSQQ